MTKEQEDNLLDDERHCSERPTPPAPSSATVEALWANYTRLTEVWKALPYGSPEQTKAFKEAEDAHERWRLAFLDSENTALNNQPTP